MKQLLLEYGDIKRDQTNGCKVKFKSQKSKDKAHVKCRRQSSSSGESVCVCVIQSMSTRETLLSSNKRPFGGLSPISAKCAYLSILSISVLACNANSAGQPKNKYHGQLSQL